ncbi:hypothetical protein, conserved [Eimeria necatrix]|uniref:Uncharacterized protein n=1 Tax=Eimeria necatrix TaxID=51315 RepID=U6MNM8_9EIME|nr:hypothetical protein, conserved [Eimeria necatrix]CDJ65611.1 hypothetical protein, conserved [Eimeria necatrix]
MAMGLHFRSLLQVLNAIAVLTDASGDDVALQYGGSVAHRKRLEPLAWAAQLPVESCSADDPRDNLWGISFEASTGSRSSSNNGSNGDGPQLRSQPSTSSLTADDAAAPEGPRSNDSTSTTGSSSSKPGGLFSGALVALKGVSSALAVQWVGRKGTTAAFVPLLPGLSTSLQRRYSNILEDGRKQQALNIWFSLYPPIKEGQQQPPIWRLEDGYDVYIHHNFLEPSFSPKDWWVLPLQRFFNGMRSAVSISHCCLCCCCTLEDSGSLDVAAARGAAGSYSDEDLQAPAAMQPAAAAATAANQTATKWLGCCRCRSGDIIAAQTAEASSGFLRSSGPSWVLDFLSPECTGILLGCTCGKHMEYSNGSSVSTSHNDSCDNGACFGAGDDIPHLLDVFTYGPWRRKAANTAASSAASVLRAAPETDSAAGCLQLSTRGLAASPVAVAAAGSKHAYNSQVDASEASLRAALEDHREAEPDESQKSSSDCSKVSRACGEQRKNLQACAHSRGRSLALLLPTLIDTATAAARALQCSYSLQLRESEQLWAYTALQQMQEQQEKEERMGSSFISKWSAAHLVLQQRSCNSALQQRLLQAHIARRLTKYPRDVVASFELQRAAAAAAAAACCCQPSCKAPRVNRESNALLFLLPPRAGETPHADEQKTDTTQQQRQVRQHQSALTFKGIIKEQLRRTLQAYSQQRQQQHDKALKSLPYELQQQLQLCSDGEMDTLNCHFGAASSSSITSCWHRASAAVSETMLQPIELHALQQEAHLLRLQRQQKHLEAAMLLPAMYAFAAVAAQSPMDKQLLHRVQQHM